MIRINEYRNSEGKLILKYKDLETKKVVLEIYQDSSLVETKLFPSWSKSCNFISKQGVTKVSSCTNKTVKEYKNDLFNL